MLGGRHTCILSVLDVIIMVSCFPIHVCLQSLFIATLEALPLRITPTSCFGLTFYSPRELCLLLSLWPFPPCLYPSISIYTCLTGFRCVLLVSILHLCASPIVHCENPQPILAAFPALHHPSWVPRCWAGPRTGLQGLGRRVGAVGAQSRPRLACTGT